jgi:hypothetical protein
VLIQANSATRNHLSDHRAIALSTYGIIYLGTPHQGAAGIDVALLLLRIQSIYSQTNKALVKHLQKDSELLRVQLSLYASISGNFDTKFFFEAYPTRILGGMQKMASFGISPGDQASYVVVFSLSQSLQLLFRGQSMLKQLPSIRTMLV